MDVHIYAHHTGESYIKNKETIYFNNNTPGIGFDTSFNTNNSIIGGVFKNSFNKTSFYIGGDIHTNTRVQLGLSYGVVTGYENTLLTEYKNHKIFPIVLPNVVFKYEKVRLKIGYNPKTNGVTDVLTFTLGYKF